MERPIIRQRTTAVHDFPGLIQSKESKYVDKTGLLYELARQQDGAQYFISRPRRFGKSLMLSTRKAMFEGRRELFKGLKIDHSLRDGFMSRILGFKADSFDTLVDRAKRQIHEGDWKGYFYESLYALYAQIPPDWQIKGESEAKRYFQLFTSMTGANPQPEVPSVLGYADAVIETPKGIYVIEFKYRRSSKAAIKQIRDRSYADKWKGGKRPVTLVGVNFNPAKRNIDIPLVEPL